VTAANVITHRKPKPEKPERVTLIGAHGFIGAAIKRHLDAAGIPVLALTSKEVDLTREDAPQLLTAKLQPPDAIVMLAALTPRMGRDASTLIRNVTMMQHVCRAVEKTGCAHFVYFSSDAVYPSGAGRVTEETLPSPVDLYGVMHLTRELMARSIANTPVLVLRPTQIHGAHDPHNSYGPNRFRNLALKEGRIALSDSGAATRDHIDIEDVAALALRCLLHLSVGTLNVATGESHSFLEVARMTAREYGAEVMVAPDAKPVTHRHYDIANTIKAFPDIRFTGLEEGIARVHRELKEGS
jgi:nucleoside-diphosphate-sugar epimerase